MSSNQLASLPEGFGSLTVGGDLYLDDNRLASLPEGFGSLTVGGEVHLYSNPIAAELHPRSFVGLTLVLEKDDSSDELGYNPLRYGNY